MSTTIFGIYEHVVNEIISEHISKIDQGTVHVDTELLDSAESSKVLADYLARIAREVLEYIDHGEDVVKDRVELCNHIIKYIADFIEKENFCFKKDKLLFKRVKDFIIPQNARILLAMIDKKQPRFVERNSLSKVIRPNTSIAENSLFTGAAHEPSMISEIKKEVLSSHRIDFLVSFIKWSGLRLIIEELTEFTRKGGKFRIITTSYLGATDYKAVEQLSRLLNTEIRISYDTARTRLHAKTYVFWRDTGFSTVYIGSSNISESAMTSGLEWNIKVSEYDSKDILDKIRATFEGYWNNPEFRIFVPEYDADILKRALRSERLSGREEQNRLSFNFDIRPYYYQQEILEKLEAEREVHSLNRNLIVAATGTGKTVIAAFDYRNYVKANPTKLNKLLFIAHRKEILAQSLDCFRSILRDLNFGTMMVGGIQTDVYEHLFVSIQSFNSKELIEIIPPDYYDYIVIDEFHHAAAPSYQAMLEHFKPKILLGLTATPERMDGKSIFSYFGGKISAEIRLHEAIERKLLSPFHYFGVTDSVDLRNVRWVNGKYDEKDLENVYVFEKGAADRRAGFIAEAIEKYCGDLSDITGIGFCATRKHAEFMAHRFEEMGIPSEYLIAESEVDLREQVKRRLITKEIKFVFVVDIYNEGVDIPEVNTVLFLRPTESLTVFIQQLGRGLRLCEGKEALTVLDFVGHANQKYSFEDRFKALLSRTRRTVEYEIKTGFVNVPKGCSIQLEKQAQEYILENIRNSINNRRNLMKKLKDLAELKHEISAKEFFESYNVKPLEVYGKKATVIQLASQAGVMKEYVYERERESQVALALSRLSYANSERWLKFLQEVLPQILEYKGRFLENLSSVERTMLNMFHYTLWGTGLYDLKVKFGCIEEAIYSVIDDKFIYNEVTDLLKYQYERIDIVGRPLEDIVFDCPLEVHCTYALDQILVALGRHTENKRRHFQEGVLYLPEKYLDVFFVTLNKSEKDYSPSTMYQDYSINEKLFHWQSQSRTTLESVAGKRYINQNSNQNNVLFFVREYKKESTMATPYTCIGLADYVSHYGSAPISIVWRMRENLPGFVLKQTAKV